MAIWGMWLRPGGEGGYDLTPEAILGNYICIGWGAPNYTGLDDEALRHALNHYYRRKTKPGYVAGQMFTFLRKIKPKRDLVIVPRYKRDEYYVGRIIGPVKVRTVGDYGDFYSRRVKWFNPRSPWKKSALPKALRQALRKRQTIWDLTEFSLSIGRQIRRPPEPDPRSRKESKRFDSQSRAFSYFLKGGRKKVFPGHKNFQVRLKRYLELKDVRSRDFEEDLVDVTFKWKGCPYIGEIKVSSRHVSVKASFRAALGQILEYKYLKPLGRSAQMVIFLDKKPDAPRIQLASKLGIGVVVEDRRNTYHLQNPAPTRAQGLHSLFL